MVEIAIEYLFGIVVILISGMWTRLEAIGKCVKAHNRLAKRVHPKEAEAEGL